MRKTLHRFNRKVFHRTIPRIPLVTKWTPFPKELMALQNQHASLLPTLFKVWSVERHVTNVEVALIDRSELRYRVLNVTVCVCVVHGLGKSRRNYLRFGSVSLRFNLPMFKWILNFAIWIKISSYCSSTRTNKTDVMVDECHPPSLV